MSIRQVLSSFVATVGLVLAASQASAVPVYNTNVLAPDYAGSRSIAGGGLVKGGGGAAFNAATLTWAITSNGDGSLHYSYSVDTNSAQGLSHFIWDLSDNCTVISACFQNLTISSGGSMGDIVFGSYTSANGNPHMPGSIIGVKANVISGGADFTFAFDSNRVPVWADFYSKGGNGNTNGFSLYNAGLNFEATDSNTGHFVAMPDTVIVPPVEHNVPVPEPGSMLLLGTGLMGAGFMRRRRKVQSSAA